MLGWQNTSKIQPQETNVNNGLCSHFSLVNKGGQQTGKPGVIADIVQI